ncbi:serine/threonine-protein kinase [Gemmatimonas sp.]|uniref:serine/threonine-protein kinase n=1 Tax=Gemmatimonas sp. TaxID=1962908 RepID=UPI00286E9ACA|nr:serine/threonine-protein kinase [Gemmatimonas sp.]
MTDTLRESLQAALGAAFQLGRELGGGGMSRVFLARDQTLEREVVVKMLSPELAQELSVERFGREIALAAALQHANIVPVLSAGVTSEGLPFYLMPFVEGASLRERVGGGRTMPIADVLLVLNDVTRALAYAHGRGVVHRDIKSDNVMLSGGAALVTDFGIAKAMSSARTASSDSQLTRMGTSLGSPAYMAPEQGAGDPDTDHRADIYALGAMAYELLTGSTPFGDRPAHAQLIAHLSEAPVPVATRRPDVPEPLARLVMQCLEKDPVDRPQQAADVLEHLADAASASRTGTTGQYAAGTTAASPSTSAANVSTRRGTRGLLIGGVALAAVAAVGWFATRAPAKATGPDDSLVAVMPFAVRDASLNVWREGLVDILSRSLDGAGALRSVSPSMSIAQSPDRADVTTATALGTSLGAGLVLFGDISPLGRDSVRLRAALVNVADSAVRQEVDVSGPTLRIDALADSLALRLLRAMGGSGSLAKGARISSMGTSSLAALKLYLQGQQFYRRGVVDSSQLAFEAAVASDSMFALGWRGVASVYIRTGREAAPEAQAALDRAIRLFRGGSPRDSLLLHGDALRLAVVRRTPAANEAINDIPAVTELLTALRGSTSRYPSDAELWLELGDAGYHFGELAGVLDTAILRDFARAIELDSMLLVPYVHAYGLALRTGRLREAATYARGLQRLSPPSAAPYYALQASLLDSAPSLSALAKATIDSLPLAYAAKSLQDLGTSPEASALSLAIAAHQSARLAANPSLPDSAAFAQRLLFAQAQRGKLIATPQLLTFSERALLAQMGQLPSADLLSEARPLLTRQPATLGSMFALYAGARDTASLQLLVSAFDSVDVAARARGQDRIAHYGDVARSYLALARGDTAAALRGLLALPMAMCSSAPCAATTTSRLLVQAKRDADAARVLDRAIPTAMSALNAAPMMLLRAEIAERMGDRPSARKWYARVVAHWGGGDAAVQETVTAARAGLARVR